METSVMRYIAYGFDLNWIGPLHRFSLLNQQGAASHFLAFVCRLLLQIIQYITIPLCSNLIALQDLFQIRLVVQLAERRD